MASAHVERLRKDFHRHRKALGVIVRYHEDDEHGAWAETWKARATHDGRVRGAVILPFPIHDTLSYYVAMHELGHLHDTTGKRGKLRLRNPKPTLEREAFAWAWALDNACVPPTRKVWRGIRERLLGYARYAREFNCKPNDDFDRLLKRARKEAA